MPRKKKHGGMVAQTAGARRRRKLARKCPIDRTLRRNPPPPLKKIKKR